MPNWMVLGVERVALDQTFRTVSVLQLPQPWCGIQLEEQQKGRHRVAQNYPLTTVNFTNFEQ